MKHNAIGWNTSSQREGRRESAARWESIWSSTKCLFRCSNTPPPHSHFKGLVPNPKKRREWRPEVFDPLKCFGFRTLLHIIYAAYERTSERCGERALPCSLAFQALYRQRFRCPLWCIYFFWLVSMRSIYPSSFVSQKSFFNFYFFQSVPSEIQFFWTPREKARKKLYKKVLGSLCRQKFPKGWKWAWKL